MKRFLFQSAFWKGMVQLTAFVLNILIARYFEAELSGYIFYVISIFSLLILFFSLSLESGIVYFGVKKEIGFNSLIGLSLFVVMITAICLIVYFAIFHPFHNNYLRNSLIVFSAITFICGHILYSFGTSFFNAVRNFVWPHAIALLINILLIILLIIKWNIGSSNFSDELFFMIYFGSFLILGISTMLLFIRKKRIKYSPSLPNKAQFIRIVHYCTLAWTGNIIFFLLYRLDYLFVEKLCSAADLGNYIQVSKLGQLFFIFPSIMASVIFPLSASQPKEKMIRWVTVLSRVILLLYLIICAIAVLIGKWLFPFVFGETFNNMYPAFILLVPGILSLSIMFALTAHNAGTYKLKTNIYGALLALCVVLVGTFIFKDNYSIELAAAISSVAYISLMIYLLYAFKKVNKTPIHQFFLFQLKDLNVLKNINFNFKRK